MLGQVIHLHKVILLYWFLSRRLTDSQRLEKCQFSWTAKLSDALNVTSKHSKEAHNHSEIFFFHSNGELQASHCSYSGNYLCGTDLIYEKEMSCPHEHST